MTYTGVYMRLALFPRVTLIFFNTVFLPFRVVQGSKHARPRFSPKNSNANMHMNNERKLSSCYSLFIGCVCTYVRLFRDAFSHILHSGRLQIWLLLCTNPYKHHRVQT